MRIKLRREKLGISQERLGEMVGVTYQQIQKYEKGINRVNVEILQKIAQSLDVSTNFFFDGEDEQKIKGILTFQEQELIRYFRSITDQEFRSCFLSLLKLASK
ncbi:MAG: helix-turn-helix transcriptional regulator [Thermodesulfobacteriota bacterium]